jgi:hypothetical protein
MTGDAKNPALKRAADIGIIEVISKPFDVQILFERIKSIAMLSCPATLSSNQLDLSEDIFRSALDIFHLYLDGELRFQNQEKSFRVDITNDMSATVHFTGTDTNGFLCISLNKDTSAEICAKILNLGPSAIIDVALACDLMEGLVKQIVGHTDNWLAPHCINISAGPASVIFGNNHVLSRRSKSTIHTASLMWKGKHCGSCHMSMSAQN